MQKVQEVTAKITYSVIIIITLRKERTLIFVKPHLVREDKNGDDHTSALLPLLHISSSDHCCILNEQLQYGDIVAGVHTQVQFPLKDKGSFLGEWVVLCTDGLRCRSPKDLADTTNFVM